jgi:act minimal PKS acyl carrier protein
MEDLRRIMRECAGEDEDLALDGDVAGVPFADLGYDSLALLATVTQVEREFHVSLPEDRLATVDTPAAFLSFVNDQLRLAA